MTVAVVDDVVCDKVTDVGGRGEGEAGEGDRLV
jgi:hypothetical protein